VTTALPWLRKWGHRLFLACGLLMLATTAAAQAPVEPQANTTPLVIDVFVREGCPHCAAAKAYLKMFTQRHADIAVIYHAVDVDSSARKELQKHSRRAGVWPPGVPTFVVGDIVHVGFSESEADALLASLIDRARGGDAIIPGEQAVSSRLFGRLSVANMGLPLFTLALGLLDGFNPCAMWVLLFLLSMLIHLKDRVRMAWIAGTFVVVSGAVYYAFMAAWLNLFLAIGFSVAVRTTLAIVALVIGIINLKDFIALGKGISLSIPESAKPGLYARVRELLHKPSLVPALLGVTVLAVVVNFIEALCTAGLPAVYTAVLTQYGLTPAEHYAYLGLYILGYIADDSLMVATAVLALNSRKLTENAGRWLKFVSGAVMLALGFILLLKPEWLF
jgi:glutaredoxin